MKHIKTGLSCLVAMLVWAVFAVYVAFLGWWMNAVAEQGNYAEFHAWAVSEIEAKNRGTAALVLIEDGRVVNEYFAGDVDRETLFPTASFSKWIAALSVMSLVERRQLDLDRPVSDYLSRWQLPDSPFDNDGVTVRRLLSHTAGLTDGLGFGDYEGGETLPPIEETLRNPRASSGARVEVAVGREPGSEFLYSGGGYLILQLLVEEVSGDTFIEYVSKSVLEPLEMSRSSYAFLDDLNNASPSFNDDGTLAPTYQYASAAATGFASSASDLSKLVEALLVQNDTPFDAGTVAAMREPHGFVLGAGIWGLGTMLYAETSNGDFVFGHDGANDPAINTSVRLNPETSDGLILLVSGHPSLATKVGSEWVLWQTGYPDFLSAERALESALIPVLIGSLIIVAMGVVRVRRRSA